MKSKKKFLSLLVFAPLLVGCGNNVSKPGFAKYSNEVKTFEKFVEELTKAKKKTSIWKDKKLGSFEFKAKDAQLDQRDVKRGKDVIETHPIYDSSEGNIKFDAKNLIISQKDEVKHSNVITDKYGTDSEEKITKDNVQSQVKDSKNYVSVNLETKEYEVGSFYGAKPAAYFDYITKYILDDSLTDEMKTILGRYTAEKKSNFKFYKDGNIFTAVENSTEKKEDETKKHEEQTEYIVQVDITEGKWSSKSYYFNEATDEYKVNYSSLAKGDVVVQKYVESYDYTVTSKDVSLKKLDLKDYVEKPTV